MAHKAIAIIPARGGSKRIPKKNLVDLGGKPLIAYTILNAKKSKYVKNNLYVSTENQTIAKVGKEFGANVVHRPKDLATDEASTLSVLKHVVEQVEKDGVEFDTVVLLQPTSPFRKSSTIDGGVKKLWDNWQKMSAVFSVKQTKFPPNWMLRIKGDLLEFVFPNDFLKIRGQDLEKTYEVDGVLYVLKKELIKKSVHYPFAHGKTGYLITDKIESVDIDDEDDLKIARAIIQTN